jgi:hypothetical protein
VASWVGDVEEREPVEARECLDQGVRGRRRRPLVYHSHGLWHCVSFELNPTRSFSTRSVLGTGFRCLRRLDQLPRLLRSDVELPCPPGDPTQMMLERGVQAEQRAIESMVALREELLQPAFFHRIHLVGAWAIFQPAAPRGIPEINALAVAAMHQRVHILLVAGLALSMDHESMNPDVMDVGLMPRTNGDCGRGVPEVVGHAFEGFQEANGRVGWGPIWVLAGTPRAFVTLPELGPVQEC